MRIILVRHGQSTANTLEEDGWVIGERNVRLTQLGVEQAIGVGAALGADLLRSTWIWTSSLLRAKQTFASMLIGAGLPPATITAMEDERLREMEDGAGAGETEAEQKKREAQGHFYYRYPGGESPSDVALRIDSFLGTMFREIGSTPITISCGWDTTNMSTQNGRPQKDVVIVFHGRALRVFVYRFLHLTVEQYETICAPSNGDIVVIAPPDELQSPQFISPSGKWGVEGLRLR